MQKKKDWDEVIYFPELLIFQDQGTPLHTFKNIAWHMAGTQ